MVKKENLNEQTRNNNYTPNVEFNQKIIEAISSNIDDSRLSYLKANIDKGRYLGWVYNFNIKFKEEDAKELNIDDGFMKLDLNNKDDEFLLFVLAAAWSITGPFESSAYFVTYLKLKRYGLSWAKKLFGEESTEKRIDWKREQWKKQNHNNTENGLNLYEEELLKVYREIDKAFEEKHEGTEVPRFVEKESLDISKREPKIQRNGKPKSYTLYYRYDMLLGIETLIHNWKEIDKKLDVLKNDPSDENVESFYELMRRIKPIGNKRSSDNDNAMWVKIPLILREYRCQGIINVDGKYCCVPDTRVVKFYRDYYNCNSNSFPHDDPNAYNNLLKNSEDIYKDFGDLYDIPPFAFEDLPEKDELKKLL